MRLIDALLAPYKQAIMPSLTTITVNQNTQGEIQVRLRKRGEDHAQKIELNSEEIKLKDGDSAIITDGNTRLAVHDTGDRRGTIVMVDGEFKGKNSREGKVSTHDIADTTIHVLYEGRIKGDTQ